MHNEIEDDAEFFEKKFKGLNFEKEVIYRVTFEACTFESCNCTDADFRECRFVDCEFVGCNLSNAKIKQCIFNDVVFDGCKLIGINWTEIKWPFIQLSSPFKFYKSNLSDSSFYQAELSDGTIESCIARSVDFREANLSHGNFIETDFENALFQGTNLQSSDFSDAINYFINPELNIIKQAKFSMPEAMNLLLGFEIKIDGGSL